MPEFLKRKGRRVRDKQSDPKPLFSEKKSAKQSRRKSEKKPKSPVEETVLLESKNTRDLKKPASKDIAGKKRKLEEEKPVDMERYRNSAASSNQKRKLIHFSLIARHPISKIKSKKKILKICLTIAMI